jgi:hypothetical protein
MLSARGHKLLLQLPAEHNVILGGPPALKRVTVTLKKNTNPPESLVVLVGSVPAT